MDIPAKVYKKFFELFRDKLYERELSPLANQNESLGKIWKQPLIDEKGRSTEVPFITAHFSVKPLYFYEKYRVAVNNPEDDVPFVTFAFVRAYEYLENIPEEKQYQGKREQWEDHADALLQEFAKKPMLQHGELDDLDSDYLIDGPFTFSEFEEERFPTGKIKKMMVDFYSAISDERYYEAWKLLSPGFQKESFWDGDFERFKNGFFNVASIDILFISNFTYETDTIKFEFNFREKGKLLDFRKIIEKADLGNGSSEVSPYLSWIFNFDELVSEYLRKNISVLDKEPSRNFPRLDATWKNKIMHTLTELIALTKDQENLEQNLNEVNDLKQVNFLDMDFKDLSNHDLQKSFLMASPHQYYENIWEEIKEDGIAYKVVFSGNAHCVLLDDGWYIDDIHLICNVEK
ncbi:hypothetical protein GO495_17620 [Chitinophaga oryziterrae]|uniref:Uncharacterized protein n=1 Tax=Chitinophaga oryziterrae TaxID=1031224 RepID=A0A6N8JDI3_9BACT|nr:hypothetical protein [Chitinophaga oryziterrae]MVT42416.1 hypothetical protein [Chitinophaga oryziterrae]